MALTIGLFCLSPFQPLLSKESEMNSFTTKRFLNDTRGANMVEYIVLVGVVALIAIAGFKLFGTNVEQKIRGQATAVAGVSQGAAN